MPTLLDEFCCHFLLYHDLLQRMRDPKLLVHISYLTKYLLPPGFELLIENDVVKAVHVMLYA